MKLACCSENVKKDCMEVSMQLVIVAEDSWARWFHADRTNLPLCLHMLWYESNANLRQSMLLCLKSNWRIWISGSSESRARQLQVTSMRYYTASQHTPLRDNLTSRLQFTTSVFFGNPSSPSPKVLAKNSLNPPWYFRRLMHWMSVPNPRFKPQPSWPHQAAMGDQSLAWGKSFSPSAMRHRGILRQQMPQTFRQEPYTHYCICNITLSLSMVQKSQTTTSFFKLIINCGINSQARLVRISQPSAVQYVETIF